MSGKNAILVAKELALKLFEELCTQVENDLRVKIPTYLKKILLMNGFDNGMVLSTLSECDIIVLEKFARSEAYYAEYQRTCSWTEAKREIQWAKLYGLYTPRNTHTTFKIPLGHRRLLLCIADYFKNASVKRDPKTSLEPFMK